MCLREACPDSNRLYESLQEFREQHRICLKRERIPDHKEEAETHFRLLTEMVKEMGKGETVRLPQVYEEPQPALKWHESWHLTELSIQDVDAFFSGENLSNTISGEQTFSNFDFSFLDNYISPSFE